MRLIDADELKSVMLEEVNETPDADYYDAIRTLEVFIKDAEPIRHGHWIKDRLLSTNGGTYGVYRCSLCERTYQDIGYGFNYCPNCGARMDEVANNG